MDKNKFKQRLAFLKEIGEAEKYKLRYGVGVALKKSDGKITIGINGKDVEITESELEKYSRYNHIIYICRAEKKYYENEINENPGDQDK